jgi:RNA polymerase primary sigma factor
MERHLQSAKRALDALTQSELDRILDTRQQKILRLRLGLEDGRRCTLQEIGIELGIRRERVRQVQMKALAQLAHWEEGRR